MTKYRLNIKYPIEEHQAINLCNLYKLRSKTFELISHVNNNYCKIKDEFDVVYECPKSWIEEIKEDSAFEKWFNECFPEGSEASEMHGLKSWNNDCWQASEKNTHKLYSDLMERIFRVLSVKNSLLEVETDEFINDLSEIVKKINEAL